MSSPNNPVIFFSSFKLQQMFPDGSSDDVSMEVDLKSTNQIVSTVQSIKYTALKL